MSALKKIRNMETPSQLDLSVMWYGDEQGCAGDVQQIEDAEQAAKELLQLRARIAELEKQISGQR